MSNSILSKDQISDIKPGWSHPVLPGHAVQGSVLMSRTDFVNPPQSSENFIWMLMEDVFGVHDVKLKYNEPDSTYHIIKTYGHLNNDGTWVEDEYDIGSWVSLDAEVVNILKRLVFVEYRFTQPTTTSMQVTGITREGQEVLLINVNFASKEYVDELVAGLEKVRADHGLISVYDETTNIRTIKLNPDENDFSIDSNDKLKSELIKDNLNSSQIKSWSIDKIKDYIKV